jgi:lipid-A-disaccharide synthase-like uncharacterized protein
MTGTFIQKTIHTLLNPWVLFGLLAQGVFFFRFIVQLYHSEKLKKVVVPMMFWYLSVIGTVMTLIYSFHIRDIVFILSSFLSFAIYFRNIYLERKQQRGDQYLESAPE